MFSIGQDPMRMEATPERVLAVCRMIAKQEMSETDLYAAMTLGQSPDKKLDEVNRSLEVAKTDLGLLSDEDGILRLAVPEEIIASPVSFRRYVASKVFPRTQLTFVLFTKWVISQNERIFSLEKWETLAMTARAEVAALSGMNENAGLGWRFWAAFLGIGYLNGTMILPNMTIRLQDLLAMEYQKNHEFGKPIAAKDFTLWLRSKLPEVDFSDALPLALSAGLRTLHDLQLVHLETRPDTERIPLYYVDADPFNEFSHITVLEGVCA